VIGFLWLPGRGGGVEGKGVAGELYLMEGAGVIRRDRDHRLRSKESSSSTAADMCSSVLKMFPRGSWRWRCRAPSLAPVPA
jgi:hypothetical protein